MANDKFQIKFVCKGYINSLTSVMSEMGFGNHSLCTSLFYILRPKNINIYEMQGQFLSYRNKI